MKILFASDHAGFEMKKSLVEYTKLLGYDVEDLGAFSLNEEDDYPDFVSLAARRISEDPSELRAVVLGGSGQGEAIVANRFPQVRAVVFNGASFGEHQGLDEIALSRQHNDANILALGARFLTLNSAKDAVKRWLETPFPGDERHVRRIKKIDQYPKHD